ncbi:hypothetical protein AB3S75_015597 [Citrus x aurantiifolia]
MPPIDDDGVIVLEPNSIVDTRWKKRESKLIEQSLIRWKKLPPEEATWEDMALIKEQSPLLTLEDKGPLPRGGIDKEPRRSARAPKPNYKFKGYV